MTPLRLLTFFLLLGACAAAHEHTPDAPATDAPSRFVAVGAAGTIVRSDDGVHWQAAASNVSANLNSIAASPALLVAVGDAGTILRSFDGEHWSYHGGNQGFDLTHVIFTGAKFIAVGASWDTGSITLTSEDGEHWSALSSPESYMFHAVAAAGDSVIAAANLRSDLQTPALFASTLAASSALGSSWNQHEGPDFRDSLSLERELVVVGWSGSARSRDGITWFDQDPSSPGLSVAASEDTLVAVGELGIIFTSPSERTSWVQVTDAVDGTWLSGVAYGAGSFVAVGNAGRVLTSGDGSQWTSQSAATGADLADIAYFRAL